MAMSDAKGPDWEALRQAYHRPQRGQGAHEAGHSRAWPSCQSGAATDGMSRASDQTLVRDLAEERAAILEYCGGLPRAEAEENAYRAHGFCPGSFR